MDSSRHQTEWFRSVHMMLSLDLIRTPLPKQNLKIRKSNDISKALKRKPSTDKSLVLVKNGDIEEQRNRWLQLRKISRILLNLKANKDKFGIRLGNGTWG